MPRSHSRLGSSTLKKDLPKMDRINIVGDRQLARNLIPVSPISTAASENTYMQQLLDESAQRRHGHQTLSVYDNVEVLLLQWKDDDLLVNTEVDRLEKVFAEKCNFTTRRWTIPSADSEDELIRRILDFRKGKTQNDLLILYYGGHAGGDAQECIWTANTLPHSPSLNWHNAQSPLLGSPANVLLILDCCFATLAARNHGVGDNWFLGASTKESVADGVSPFDFTSAFTRELERCADLYWKKDVTFSVVSIHHALIVWERDLRFTPNLARLTDHECSPIDLTPLLYARDRPRLKATSSFPPKQPSFSPTSSSIPRRPSRKSSTLPPNTISNVIREHDSQNKSGNPALRIQLSQNESQSLLFTCLPTSTGKIDVVHWLENRLGRGSVIAKMAPLLHSSSKRDRKETIVTFADVATAKQAEAIRNLSFPTKAAEVSDDILIDRTFQGLSCTYSSTKSPDKQPNIDIILVHGAHGHPINSFACHFTEPSNEIMWPRDFLPKVLEEVGIFPRVMTLGWDANTWLDPYKSIPNAYGDLAEALSREEPGNISRPVIFIAHGIGGLLVKQIVVQTINFGFNFPDFENPIKACYFLAVPHNDGSSKNGFASVLSNMQSMLKHSSKPVTPSTKALKSRNTSIINLSTEFDGIRQEYGIDCVSFAGERGSPDQLVVPVSQAILDDSPGKVHRLDLDYKDLAQLPTQEDRKSISVEICKSISEKLHLNKKPVRVPNKETVFALLKRYDTAFLVDDSDSMSGNRWTITKQVLAKIASIAVLYDRNGVDIRFFNTYMEDDERLNLTSAQTVMSLFDQVDPKGPTPTADVLQYELNEYVYEYKKNRHRKGLNLIVITDGEPDSGQKVEDVIVRYARKLAELEAPPLQVGVQFVQIGGDKAASDFLKGLDDDLQKKHDLDRDVSDLGNISKLKDEIS